MAELKFMRGYTQVRHAKPMLWLQTLLCPRYHELIHDTVKDKEEKQPAVVNIDNSVKALAIAKEKRTNAFKAVLDDLYTRIKQRAYTRAELAQVYGMSEDGMWKRLARLRAEGRAIRVKGYGTEVFWKAL